MLKQLDGTSVRKATNDLAAAIRKAGYPGVLLKRSKPTVKYGQFYEARLADGQEFAPEILAFVDREFPEHAGRNSPSVISLPDKVFHRVLDAFKFQKNHAENRTQTGPETPTPQETTVALMFGLANPKDYHELDENLNTILSEYSGMTPAIREANRYLVELGVQSKAWASYKRIANQAELESFLASRYREARKSVTRQTTAEKNREWAETKADLAVDGIERLAYETVAQEAEAAEAERIRSKKRVEIENKIVIPLLERIERENRPPDESEREILSNYGGVGGSYIENATTPAEMKHNQDALTQFFTPRYLCGLMYDLAAACGFPADGRVLEPSCGSGRLIGAAPATASVTAFEVSELPYRISKMLYPKAQIHNKYFEQAFLDSRERNMLPDKNPTWLPAYPFDLVIGNPPYGKHTPSIYTPMLPKYSGIEFLFLEQGARLLKPGGLLVFLTASNFMRNGATMNGFKDKFFRAMQFVTASRMPSKLMDGTEAGTDILVFRKK